MRNLIIAILIDLLTACSATKVHVNFKYAKKEFTLQRPTLLHTDGIYIRMVKINNADFYTFLRFFDNGRCYECNNIKGLPVTDSLKHTNPTIGTRTFYRNEGNKIKYEQWGDYYSRYAFVNGIVDESGLTIISFKSRGIGSTEFKLPEPQRYKFMPLDLSDKADW